MSEIAKYSPDQPRDDHGRFGSGLGSIVAPKAKVASAIRQPDGGFTLDPKSNKLVTEGFGVSPYPERSKKLPKVAKMTDKEVDSAVKQFTVANRDLLAKKGHMLGGWHDPQTGDAWLDVSIVASSAAEAVKIGREHDQIAYFDFATGASVDIDRNATSGQG